MKNLLFDFISKYISVNEEEKKAILSLDIFHSVKKNTILLKQGQYLENSFFVLKGCDKFSEELLVKQQIDFDSFKISSPEQRYLTLIGKRPDLIQRVPQYQLASFLGIKPQSLSRLRNRVIKKSKG